MPRNIFRHLILTSLILFSSTNVCAVAPGFYMGIMGGPSTNTGSTVDAQVQGLPITTPATPRSQQFGTRLFMGNMINSYVGVEGGLSLYSKIKYDTKGVPTCGGTTSRVRDFDVVVKGAYPIYMFDIFGKAGVALAYQTNSGALNPNFGKSCGDSTNETKFRPTVSIGASYDFNQNWVADLSWNRTMVGGIVKNIDLFAIGIAYHFVDVYCGQFLC